MDPYSLSLGLALLALAASAIALLAGWILGRGSPGGSSPLPRRATRIAAGGALALAAFSLAFHLATGHRPGTAAAMGPSRFVAEHPALIGVPAIAGLLLRAAAAHLHRRQPKPDLLSGFSDAEGRARIARTATTSPEGRSLLMRFLLLAPLAALLAAPAAAQQPSISFQSTEVAPGLYMIEGVGGFAGGNLGLLTGEDGVALIDDGLPPLTDKVLAAVGELTDEPVDFLINTHVHGDHVGGNEAFAKRGATIVAHENLRRRMVADGIRGAPAPEDALPVVTFSDAVTFHLDGHEAFVFHVESAHTDGDAVIHFRNANVIHAGDVMFNRLFPFIDLDSGGSVEGYIAAQKRILELADDETKIIPGHGPLAGKRDLETAVAMLEDSLARVRALVEAGESEEAILAANPLADYHDEWNWGFITTERMTQTLIRSLNGG